MTIMHQGLCKFKKWRNRYYIVYSPIPWHADGFAATLEVPVASMPYNGQKRAMKDDLKVSTCSLWLP
jgi:hypothetical protein